MISIFEICISNRYNFWIFAGIIFVFGLFLGNAISTNYQMQECSNKMKIIEIYDVNEKAFMLYEIYDKTDIMCIYPIYFRLKNLTDVHGQWCYVPY